MKTRPVNWNFKNLEYQRQLNISWRRRNYAKTLYNRLKNRALKRELPFDLTITWIEKRLKGMTCEITGVPLSLDLSKTLRSNPWSPSFDQKKPGKGYTKRNTQLVCWCYNAAKGAWGHDAVVIMAEALTGADK